MKLKYTVLSVAFFAILAIGGIVTFLLPHRDFSENENRYLASFPKFSFEALSSGEWQSEFESFLSDQFVGRDMLCGVCSSVKTGVGIKDISGAFICKDGYITEMITDKDIDLEQYKQNVEKINEFLEKYSSLNSTVMLVPSASTVMADKLPPFAPMYDADKLYGIAKETVTNADAFIDLREDFKAENDGLYYKTDHHWNYKGASLAYKIYCENTGMTYRELEHNTVSKDFYGTLWSKALVFGQPKDEVCAPVISGKLSVEGGQGSVYVESALTKKDKYTYFFGGNAGIITVENPECENGKTLLVIKDSFANSFVPYLTEDYSKIIMVDLRYYNGRVSKVISEENVTDITVLYGMTTFAQANHFIKLSL